MKTKLMDDALWQGRIAIVPLGVCAGFLCGTSAFWMFESIAMALCVFVTPVAFSVIVALKVTS